MGLVDCIAVLAKMREPVFYSTLYKTEVPPPPQEMVAGCDTDGEVVILELRNGDVIIVADLA